MVKWKYLVTMGITMGFQAKGTEATPPIYGLEGVFVEDMKSEADIGGEEN